MIETIVLGCLAAIYTTGCFATLNCTGTLWAADMERLRARGAPAPKVSIIIARGIMVIGWPLYVVYDLVHSFWKRAK